MSEVKRFDVFLSHASADEVWVKRLKAALQKNGLSVWLACDEILPGDSFPRAIEKGIAASLAVALVVSPESLASGWVQKEYAAAQVQVQQSKVARIIPILLRTAELPPFLDCLQHADFRDESQFNVALNLLTMAIKASAPERIQNVARVSFISSEYPPRILGGLGIHVSELTTALSRKVAIDVLLPDPEDRDGDYERSAAEVQPLSVGVNRFTPGNPLFPGTPGGSPAAG